MLLILGGVTLLGVLLLGVRYRHARQPYLLYAVPVVNVVADALITSTEAFPVHSGVVRVGLLLTLLVFMLPRVRVNRVNAALLVFLLYLAVIGSMATDPARTYAMYTRVFFALIMFPIAYQSFRRVGELRKLNVGLTAAVAFIGGLFIVAQLFQIGRSVYIADAVYLGTDANSGVYVAYVAAYALVVLPSLLLLRRSRGMLSSVGLGAVYFVALLVLVLVFRRGAMLAFAAGAVVYFVFSRQRARILRLGMVAAVLAALASPLYVDTLVKLALKRGDVVGFVQNTEAGRMAEFGYVGGEFLDRGLKHSLFGSELFNSRIYMGVSRPLHVDFMNLLLGAGAVGLALYLLIFVRMALHLRRTRDAREPPWVPEIRATGYALMAASLMLSLSSQIWVITPLSLFFLYMGAILGVLHGERERGWGYLPAPGRNAHAAFRRGTARAPVPARR